jgi:putative spermidine/putrescine transport system permease protein
VAIVVAVLTTAVSFLAALATTRRRFAGRDAFELLLLSPLLFPMLPSA